MDIARAPQGKHRRYALGAGAGVVLLLGTVAVSRLKPAEASVERSSLVIDSVRRGDLVREVRGPGTLVPEQIVEPSTVLLEMSNPDVQIQALQAQQALSEAQARLVELRVQLEGARLS